MICTMKKFDYEQKRWGQTPITNLHNDFQGLELYYFLNDAFKYIDDKKVTLLDSGCGAGNIVAFFKKQFPRWSITGIDISYDAIHTAKKQFSGISFIRTSADKLMLRDGSMSVVTALDTLEHYDSLDAVLDEIYRVLKNNGIFYVSIPLEKQMPTVYGLLFVLGWRGKMNYAGHVNFFTHKEFRKRVESHGFRLVKKRFSYHLLFSIADIGYYLIQGIIGNQRFSFETSVYEAKPGINKTILSFIKKTISFVSFLESRLLFWFPGGKGHFVFIKNKKNDFFSDNPPVTMLEDLQIKYGLKKVLRPKDLEIIRQLKIFKLKQKSKILDFGCANGIWLERILATVDCKGLGVDIADKLIAYAKKRRNAKARYYCTMRNWPIEKGGVDFCYSLDTFEHIIDKKEEIRKLYESMRKGANFLFFTLNPKNKYTFDWLFEKFGSDYLYRRADHKKELFYDPKDFTIDLQRAGFKNVKYVLYAGPANLSWDVFCYLYLGIIEALFKKIGLTGLLPAVLNINDYIVRLVYPLNKVIDRLFIDSGYSNGYFIRGEK
jgi:ubiquinone/menaquinone biosynthesis C-methylase UbiE